MQTNRLQSNGHSGQSGSDTAVETPPLPHPARSEDESQVGSAPRTSNFEPRIAAAQQQRFRIPGDVIARTVADLPDDQRDAIKWAAGYCRQRNLSTEEFGSQLTQPGSDKPYSGDSVYQAFVGRRDPGSLERFCKAVQVLRKRLEETSARHASQFVETFLARKIFTACRRAITKQRPVFIFGETQIGKTRALEEYARRHNHGETILVRMPAGGSLNALLAELAIRLGIGTGNKRADLRRRILESFDERVCLIVDEMEQCIDHGRQTGLAAIEFLREIWDRRKCGLVLCGALSFRNTVRTSALYSLRKLWLRGDPRPLQLPNRPPLADLNLFAQSFGLSPAEDKPVTIEIESCDDQGEPCTHRIKGNPLHLQAAVIRDYGLGRWLTLLEDAQDIARESKSKITWGRVIAAHALSEGYEGGAQ